MKRLTKAEEQVMQILWRLEKGLVKDILQELPEPKPAYNTVSTIVRILEKKGFISHKAYGNTHEYYPTVTREEYARFHLGNFLKNYFDNSFPQLAAFFARENNLTTRDLEEILKATENELKKTTPKRQRS
jgi:predicted transcriptional regulator